MAQLTDMLKLFFLFFMLHKQSVMQQFSSNHKCLMFLCKPENFASCFIRRQHSWKYVRLASLCISATVIQAKYPNVFSSRLRKLIAVEWYNSLLCRTIENIYCYLHLKQGYLCWYFALLTFYIVYWLCNRESICVIP